MFCHSALCSPLLGASIVVLVCLNLSCLLVCACVWMSSQASVREGPGLSAWAPPLQLPYFIRGHQLNSCSTVRVRLQFFSFPLPLSLFLSLWQTVPQAHSRPSSSYDFSLCQLTSVFCFLPNSPMPSRSLPSRLPERPFSRLPFFPVQVSLFKSALPTGSE